MKKIITIMALLFATVAHSEPQRLPSSDQAPAAFAPAVHRTYSVDERVFVVIKDSQGNFILTPYEVTEDKGKNFIIKPILIIQASN